MPTALAYPIHHFQAGQTYCKATSTTEDVQLVRDHRLSDRMLTAALPTQNASDANFFPIPDGRVDGFSPETLLELLPVSDFLKTRELKQVSGNGDRDIRLVQATDIQRAELSRQLATSAVDLILEKETQVDGRNGDRPFVIHFCAEAYLNGYTDLLRVQFFNGGELSATSFFAKHAILKTATKSLHEESNDTKIGKSNEVMVAANGISREARQFSEWSRENDIGIAMLRMFIATWNQIRNTLRVERQMQIAEIKQISEAAVAALIQEGKDKFIQEALNAWASIASSIVQLVPIAAYAAYKRIGAKTDIAVADLTKNPLSAKERKMLRADKWGMTAQEFNNVVLIARAVGEGVAGIINFGASFKGRAAANDHADFTRKTARMQAENFDLENLNARSESTWQYIMQLVALIAERQNQLYTVNTRV